jgi:hypothetical protein
MQHIFASVLLVLVLGACNPCDIEVVSDTVFIAPGCPSGTTENGSSAAPTEGSTSAGASTDATIDNWSSDSSGGDTEQTCATDDDCAVDETCDQTTHTCFPVVSLPPTCVDVPIGGEAWGPCFVGGICNPGAECHEQAQGNVCIPPCSSDKCPAFKCFNATCDADNQCTPTCSDNMPCPVGGMFCSAGECLYPAFAPLP